MSKKLPTMNKKAMNLGDVPGVFLSLVLIVTIGVAAYLVIAGLRSGITGTDAQSNVTIRAIDNFTLSMNNVVSYAPTWGTIIGVAILIGIVVAVFAFGGKKFGGGE